LQLILNQNLTHGLKQVKRDCSGAVKTTIQIAFWMKGR